MLSAVNFNDQSFFQTDKIDDVVPQRLLAAKFITINLPETKLPPEQPLDIGRVASAIGALANEFGSYPPILAFPRKGERNRTSKLLDCSKFSDVRHVTVDDLTALKPLDPNVSCSPHQIHRSFGIRAMLARPCAAARMMRNFHQWKLRYAEELRFGAAPAP